MIISVIGSGGKTTKIKQLKDQYLKEGKSVLMTTSTHMKIEENTLVDPSYEEIINEIKKYGYVHAGSKAKNQKIKALDDEVLEKLKKDPSIDLSVIPENEKNKSRSSENRKDLEDEKNKTNTRKKKSNKNGYLNFIIYRDREIIFDNEKLDALFGELKALPIDKKYSFAVLLRAYLEQSLYFFLKENKLLGELSVKIGEESKKASQKKVSFLIKYIKETHHIKEDINIETCMNILKFSTDKEFVDTSLKAMLDFVLKNKIVNEIDPNTYKNLKDYIERIKMGLDLAIHNLETIVDPEHNKRAWKHLEPLFIYLSENINNKD